MTGVIEWTDEWGKRHVTPWEHVEDVTESYLVDTREGHHYEGAPATKLFLTSGERRLVPMSFNEFINRYIPGLAPRTSGTRSMGPGA